ncbi:MAG TPA: DUF5977 domain-containing protein [Chitinophagaceae bacterium]|nr:DUF5977 domain-containing protein [Chitinophagaceae bacterium]
MKKPFTALLLVCMQAVSLAQDGSHAMVNKLPDFIPPTPEASAILKADQLSIGYTTGSPNISIPLGSLQTGGYTLGISLNYSSTGIKVDEYASMVGMGWTLTYGGVVSRTVMDKPDEDRTVGNHNLVSLNFNSPSTTERNFLKNAVDKELDIFSFSFPGYGGKFILNSSYEPVQLTRNNLKIQVISGSFQNGFIITTDNGTAYHFQDVEISTGRNPTGTDCEKTNETSSVKTSWYLTKIVLPSTQKQINFTYTTANVTFQSSIAQTISKVTASNNFLCVPGEGQSGVACPVGTIRFSTCISQQVVTTKFIAAIETSDGDKAEFFYDGTARTDLEGGKRLASMTIRNRNALKLRDITFVASYENANSGTTAYRNKRLFLNSVYIRGGEISTATGPLTYNFTYNDKGNLPSRLAYSQDWYGYYNGKSTNASLIPILASTDVNYGTYSNGTGTGSVTFGDRSIDTVYSAKGLLTKIQYPTGGYDTLIYIANKYVKAGTSTELLAGGHSVARVISYTDAGSKALEREFIYRYKSDNALSAMVMNEGLKFSESNTVKRDGYTCSGEFGITRIECDGPTCTYAVVTSNSSNPIAALGAQHLYYRSVLEVTRGASTDNGMTEHVYTLFGNLDPRHWLGNVVLNCPYQVVPDVVIGERLTNIYKRNGSSYELVKSTERKLRLDGLDEYSSYSVKRKYVNICEGTPPSASEFDAFDVDEYYINTYTVLTDTIIEKEYADGGLVMTKLTKFEYGSSAYTYPTRTTTTGSDGLQLKTERKYPPDYTGLSYMTNRNIIGPVVEEKQFKNNNVTTTLTTKFKDWYSNATVIAPDTVDLVFGTSTQAQRILYHGYDTHGNVSEVSKEGDERYCYIWDYNRNFAIAKVQNASINTIAYTSFEADGKGGWNWNGTVLTAGGVTGHNSFNGTVSKTVASGNYVVTAWTKTSSSLTVNSTSGTQLRIAGSWKLLEWNLSSVSSVTVVGTDFDEVRLYPKGALMTTFCYEPQVGVTSQCDVNNRIIYYEYDGMSRLMLIRDQDKYVLKKFCYNYMGQLDSCNVYYNAVASQSFTRNNCTGDSTGTSVTYTVPANKYSGYTQADADAKAQAEITAFGQANANAKGTCVYLCTTGNCTGANKKCVNGVCETGIKVYTGSVQLGPHLWECTYHYEWSDGSWSQNYTEESPTQCIGEM